MRNSHLVRHLHYMDFFLYGSNFNNNLNDTTAPSSILKKALGILKSCNTTAPRESKPPPRHLHHLYQHSFWWTLMDYKQHKFITKLSINGAVIIFSATFSSNLLFSQNMNMSSDEKINVSSLKWDADVLFRSCCGKEVRPTLPVSSLNKP